MREQEMRTHFMQEIWEDGIHRVIDRVILEALDGPEYVYLSVDIDVLDPGFAPGTGTPEPGGMSPIDLLRTVRRIATDTRIVGLDVVEVAPAYDHADTTANNGHRVVWEAVSGMAKRRSLGLDAERPS
jgi:agmatinase